jgi:hypothetical protein
MPTFELNHYYLDYYLINVFSLAHLLCTFQPPVSRICFLSGSALVSLVQSRRIKNCIVVARNKVVRQMSRIMERSYRVRIGYTAVGESAAYPIHHNDQLHRW